MRLEASAPVHAALYIRLSKEDARDGPSESVQNQLALLQDFAAKHGLSVYDTYIDDGWSGTRFDRPGFQRMIRDIEAHKIDMVITKDLSRLGRDYIMTGYYMERYFPEHRVRYLSVLDGIDTGTETAANELTPFCAILSDLYAKDISKKIRSVKHDKQCKGQFIGGKAVYGYQLHPTEKNKLIPDETAAPVVRQIFSLALSGQSSRQIAVWLNAHGIPSPAVYAHLPVSGSSPYSGQWSSSRVSEMLQNETYIGNMVQGRRVKLSYKSKKCLHQPKEKWIVVPDTHTPIIDREIFFKVQQLLQSRRRTRRRTYDFPLKGRIFCHECGYPLGVVNRKNAAGQDVLYFICRTYQRFTRSGTCTCHSIKEQTVRTAVFDTLHRFCDPYLTQAFLLPIADSVLQAQHTKDADRTLQTQRDLLSTQLEQLYQDKLDGLLSEPDFRHLYAKLCAKRTALCTQYAPCQMESDSKARAQALTQQFLDTALENRAFLTELIERVELTADKQLLIFFRFSDPASAPQVVSDGTAAFFDPDRLL